MAFKSLPQKEQAIFLSSMLKDKRLREDLIDIAIAESMAKDKSRPFSRLLKKSGTTPEIVIPAKLVPAGRKQGAGIQELIEITGFPLNTLRE